MMRLSSLADEVLPLHTRSRRAAVWVRRHASLRPGQRGMIELLLRGQATLQEAAHDLVARVLC